MRDQQHNEPTPAELDMLAEGCLHGDHASTPALHGITGPSDDAQNVSFPRYGFGSLAKLRVLATLLISILIMLAGAIATATFV